MTYAEKVVGAVCTSCRQGNYVRNPKTGKVFCDKKCWLNGSNNQSGTQTPNQPQNVPQSNFNVNPRELEELRAQIGEINLVIQKMREAFYDHETRLSEAQAEITGFRTLMIDLRGKDAVDLHTEPKKKFEFSVTKPQPVVGSDGDMPVIEFPEGFLKK